MRSLPLNIHINTITLILSSATVTCEDSGSPYNSYTYSPDDTPCVNSITPQNVSPQEEVSISFKGISDEPEDNVFTIGGSTCQSLSNHIVSISKTAPDFKSSTTGASYVASTTDNCTIPILSAGSYRVILHVAGKGWGHTTLDSTIVRVVPIIDSWVPGLGSLQGGSLLSLETRGLLPPDIVKSRVTIGNSPCLIQTIKSTGELTCLTTSAVDDGYSSVVHRDSALAYWSLQADHFQPSGEYIDSDGIDFYQSKGTMGRKADAALFGEVQARQIGISGNNLTDQSAGFTASYLQTAALDEFSSRAGFGMDLWLNSEAAVVDGYRIVIDSASYLNGYSNGFLLILNPCGELEFWIATGNDVNNFIATGNCQLITDITTECGMQCSGHIIVTESHDGRLPRGVWHVLRSDQAVISMQWQYVSFGWVADNFEQILASSNDSECTVDNLCSGTQSLFTSTMISSTTTYLRLPNSTITLGGTDRISLADISVPTNLDDIMAFSGKLDEIAYYIKPLTDKLSNEHLYYGTKEEFRYNQLLSVTVDGVDNVGTGVVPNVVYLNVQPAFRSEIMVNWGPHVNNQQYFLSEDQALRFEWTG